MVGGITICIFLILIVLIFNIFEGSMVEADESPLIQKITFKVVEIKKNNNFYEIKLENNPQIIKIAENVIEFQNSKSHEMRLEVIQITTYYIQKRWLRQEKYWYGIPHQVTYIIYL